MDRDDQSDTLAAQVSKAVYRLGVVGDTPGEVAAWLIGIEGLPPVPAMKVLTQAGLPLAVAKVAVDAALPPREQTANWALRQAAVDSLAGEPNGRHAVEAAVGDDADPSRPGGRAGSQP